MINNLTVTSPHLTTSGAYTTPYIGNNGQSAGNVRWNTMTQQMEVFDGSTWINISQNVTVGIMATAEEAIRWATQKMQEEIDLKQRMDQHPGLRDAYEKFQMMDILTKEEDDQRAG
jgi:hypothetical protein